jgi:hypothetical protein
MDNIKIAKLDQKIRRLRARIQKYDRPYDKYKLAKAYNDKASKISADDGYPSDTEDTKRTIDLLEKAIEENILDAKVELANMYAQGYREENIKKYHWLKALFLLADPKLSKHNIAIELYKHINIPMAPEINTHDIFYIQEILDMVGKYPDTEYIKNILKRIESVIIPEDIEVIFDDKDRGIELDIYRKTGKIQYFYIALDQLFHTKGITQKGMDELSKVDLDADLENIGYEHYTIRRTVIPYPKIIKKLYLEKINILETHFKYQPGQAGFLEAKKDFIERLNN